MKMRIGVEGFLFDSAHYTLGASEKCLNLHGHTFKVDVEVEGELDPSSGMVLDFGAIKEAVARVLRSWDHCVIVPRGDLGKVSLGGPFKSRIKAIDAPAGTTEFVALEIAKEIYQEVRLPVTIKLYEGFRNYAVATYP